MPKALTVAAAAIVVAVFLGDAWIGITIPIALLLLPLVFLLNRRSLLDIPRGGVALAAGIFLAIAAQTAWGYPPRGKPDLVVYLPIAYAGLTLLALRGVFVPEKMLLRSLLIGGAVTAATMIAAAVLLPSNVYPIPGQAFWLTESQYATGADIADAHPSVGTAAPTVLPASEDAFYSVKNLFRNNLGRSNYLAGFFLVVGTVALFARRYGWAAVFGALVFITLSRLGFAFMAATVAGWALQRVTGTKVFWPAIVAGAGSLIAATVVWQADVLSAFLPASLEERGRMWHSAVGYIMSNPVLGSPRSYVLESIGTTAIWNPHNSLLMAWAYFGLTGLAALGAYYYVAFSTIFRRAAQSEIWTGVAAGLVALFFWSLFEPFLLTPAVEILIAALYAIAAASEGRDCSPSARMSQI